MDKRSRMMFIALGLITTAAICATFYRYVGQGDYRTFTDENDIPSPWDILQISE